MRVSVVSCAKRAENTQETHVISHNLLGSYVNFLNEKVSVCDTLILLDHILNNPDRTNKKNGSKNLMPSCDEFSVQCSQINCLSLH